jgi:hypothetical protein
MPVSPRSSHRRRLFILTAFSTAGYAVKNYALGKIYYYFTSAKVQFWHLETGLNTPSWQARPTITL